MTMTGMRDLIADDRVPAVVGRVALHEGETQHYQVNDEGQLMVSVVTLTHQVPIWALMTGGVGGGMGVWTIPAIDTEVLLSFDDGEFEGEAYLIGCHGDAPANLAPGRILILGDEIEIRSVGGVARKLAFKDELQDVVDALHEHDHVYIPGSGTPTTTTANPSVPSPVGTSTLKAE